MAEETSQTQVQDPYQFLKRFPGAPSKDTIATWKAQAPSGRVRLKVSNDGGRVYLMRAIGGLEMSQLASRLPQSTTPDRAMSELHILVATTCCLWTSVAPDGKLTDMILRASGAGLPQTLHDVVSIISDYEDPQTLESLSVDL